ncbi:MAG TPA: hypothetical protein VEJ63_18260 [Planctomycetota bacterium]|nr:hypothetical protein [Planctomycetota bacterium]
MKTNGLMAATILVIGLGFWTWGEKILLYDGAGVDGVLYCQLVRNFENLVQPHSLDYYYTQRVFPCGVVALSMTVAGVERTQKNAIRAFDLYNVLLLGLCAFLWGLIADRLALNDSSKWLGFIAFFVNFCTLKFHLYYPTLTDVTTLTFGLLFIYLYLRQSVFWLTLATIAAAFTWPTGMITGLIFILFSRDIFRTVEVQRVHSILAVAAALLVTAGSYYVINIVGQTHDQFHLQDLLLPSLLGLFWYMLGIQELSRTFPGWPLNVQWRRLLPRIAVAVGVLLCTKALISYLAAGYSTNDIRKVIYADLSMAAGKPLIFLVAHAVYFGPIVCVMLLCWPQVCRHIRAAGPGMILVALSGFVLAIGSESRQLLLVYPLFVIYAVVAVQELKLPRSFLFWFLLVSIAMSKIWWKTNVGPENASVADLRGWPWQRFFSSIGYFMNPQTYSIQLTALIFLCYGFKRFYLRPKAAEMPAVESRPAESIASPARP